MSYGRINNPDYYNDGKRTVKNESNYSMYESMRRIFSWGSARENELRRERARFNIKDDDDDWYV